MEAIDKARSVIEDRLKDLREEERRLEQALKHLVGRDGAKPKTGRAKSSTARTRKRAPRGQREKQLLASIKAHPELQAGRPREGDRGQAEPGLRPRQQAEQGRQGQEVQGREAKPGLNRRLRRDRTGVVLGSCANGVFSIRKSLARVR